MKRLIEEVEGEGIVSLMGQRITLFCVNYIYTGKLVGVNDSDVKLSDPSVVYETGPLNDADWKDAQEFPNDIYIRTSAIESYLVLK